MKWISFVFYKSYYFFLIFWLIDLITSIGRYFLINFDLINVKKKFIQEDEYIYLISMTLADLMAGLLVLITKRQTKTENEEKINKKEKKLKRAKELELIYNDLSAKENKFFFILIISILDLIGRSANFLYALLFPSLEKLDSPETAWIISIDIISRIIFSKIILKSKVYRHHIASTLFFVIGFIPITICGIYLIEEKSKNWPYILFIIPKFIVFAIGDTLSKIILNDKFLLPHYLMFYKGLCNLCMHIIIILPILLITKSLKFTNDEGDNFISDGNIFTNIILMISTIVTLFLKGFCIFNVIYIFSPQHVCFLNITISLVNFIIFKISDKRLDIFKIIIYIFSFIIIIFGTLVHNEMIIINVFKLNKQTKVFISKRGKNEILEMNPTILLMDKINEEEEEDDDKSNNTNSIDNNVINSE